MHTAKQFIIGPGHRFLAISRAMESIDLTEVATFAAHDGELIHTNANGFSWNFHPLASGRYCLSRTAWLCDLFEKFPRECVLTHGVIIEKPLLNDYSCHPISLFKHLDRLGFWRAGLEVMRRLLLSHAENKNESGVIPVLRTIAIDGGAEAVRVSDLSAVVDQIGTRRFATLLDQLLGNCATAVSSDLPSSLLIGALLDTLPIECRAEISFTTGLGFSFERFARLLFIGSDAAEKDRVQKQFNLPILSANSSNSDDVLPTLRNRWSMFWATLLEQNREQEWGALALLDNTQSLSDLSKLGRRYFRELGLEEIYQKMRECRQNGNGKEMYQVFQARLDSHDEALRVVASFLPPTESRSERTPVADEKMKSYLAAVSDSFHGNPIAQFHLHELFDEIANDASPDERDVACDILLREGVRQWNEQRAQVSNASWKSIENQIDTLSDVLNLWGEAQPHANEMHSKSNDFKSEE
ncbi:MAG: hypothetical protein Q4D38_13835 [Planctomycetia bacterium]|nr:hypothetical protein [Planctomycetia bacterium]